MALCFNCEVNSGDDRIPLFDGLGLEDSLFSFLGVINCFKILALCFNCEVNTGDDRILLFDGVGLEDS